MSENFDISSILKQIIDDQLNYGINLSRNSTHSPEELVYEIQKCLKQIRSLFRLFKPITSEADFHNYNELICESIRLLNYQSESYVNCNTFQELDKILSDSVSLETRLITSNYLNKQKKEAYTNRKNAFHNKIVSVAFQLSRIRDYIANLKTRNCPFNMLILTIGKNFDKTIAFYNISKISPHVEAINKWRRYCNHVLFELKYSPLERNTELNLFISKIDLLTKLLDKEHDLAILDKIIKMEIYPEITQNESVALHQIIEKERHTFQKKAFWLGAEVFAKNSTVPRLEIVYIEKVINA
jgi:hypothetical protein